ncbi:MAG TPA: hypothetical protein VL400_15995 [Polyangiaceae bacterium]|jgi:hypothetical protein|nr:hypothetical protein [Polyangiaceae bacterium]
MKHSLFAAFFVAACALSGCASNAHLDTPENFAELEHGDDFDYRATSASGVVIGVRVEKNAPRGNLDFWVSALDAKLEKSGYVKKGDKPEKVATGTLDGARLRFERTKDGRPHEYWLTVFVHGDDLLLVEAAGDTAFFTKDVEKKIDEATRTLQPG